MTSRKLEVGQILGYLAFSHGWTWGFWALAAWWGTSIWEPPALWFFYLGGVGVLLGVVVMTHLTYGRSGLGDLGRRLVDPRRIGGRWWFVILLFFPALKLLSAGVAWLVGTPPPVLQLPAFDDSGGLASLLATMGFILLMGPFPEEIGWRGYLQDRLQADWTALTSSLFVGAVWGLWHLPLFFLPGYYEAFQGPPPVPSLFLLSLFPTAILYTWLYNNTDRSLLAVILFHFVDNLSGEWLGLSTRVDPYTTAALVLAGVAVTYGWGPTTLRGRDDRSEDRDPSPLD